MMRRLSPVASTTAAAKAVVVLAAAASGLGAFRRSFGTTAFSTASATFPPSMRRAVKAPAPRFTTGGFRLQSTEAAAAAQQAHEVDMIKAMREQAEARAAEVEELTKLRAQHANEGGADGEEHHESTRTRRFYNSIFSNWQRGLVTSIGACMGVAAVAVLLWVPFKTDAPSRTADMASEALNDVKLKEQATVLSKQVVENVLQDQESVELLVSVIKRLLAEQESRLAVTLFIQSIFEDRHTQEISKKFVIELVKDPWVRHELQKVAFGLVLDLLDDDRTKDVMAEFLLSSTTEALKDAKLHQETGKAFRSATYFAINPWASTAEPASKEEKPAA